MQFYERPETDGGILMAMLLVMFHQYRYFQQVMELRKGEHINGDEKYTGNAFQGCKDTKKEQAFKFAISVM